MIRLRTLGPVLVHVADKQVPATNEQIHCAVLFLVAERGKPISRRLFAEMFFPSQDPDAAAHAGRQLVYRLRKMGIQVLGDSATITLEKNSAQWDVDLLRSRGHATDTELESLSHGYLSEFSARQSEGFLKWLDAHRSAVASDIRGLLVRQIKSLRASASFGSLGLAARACLALDPLNEEATLAAAESLAASGAKAEALELIDKYVDDIGTRSASLRVAPGLLRERISDYIMEPDRRVTPIMGRDVEIAALASIVSEASRGDPSVCFVSGPAGIGKTRLLEEACAAAALSSHAVVRTRLSPYDTHRAYAVLRDLGRALLDVPGALGASPEALGALRGLCGRGPSQFPNRPTSEAETQAIEAEVRRAVLGVIDAIADEQPLVMCVEDADDIDPASLQLLLALLEGERRICCLIASRRRLVDDAAPYPRAHIREIRLRQISGDASRALLSQLFEAEGRQVHPVFVQNAVRVSAGVPLLLHLLFRDFLDRGDPEALPRTLFDTLAARLEQLEEPAKCVFDAVSILGSQSNDSRLESLTGLPRFSLVHALRHLEESGFLRNIDDLILPSHELLASAALRRMPGSVARLLHRSAARILETDGIGQLEPLAIASHWESCGEKSRAVSALKCAADTYCKLGRPRESIAVLHRAREMTNGDESGRAIDGSLVVAYMLAGEDRKAVEIATSLGIFLGSGSQEEQTAAVACLLGSGLEFEGYTELLKAMAYRRDLSDDVRAAAAWALVAISEDAGSPILAKSAIDSIADIDPSNPNVLHARLVYEAVHGSPTLAAELGEKLSEDTTSSSPFGRISHLCSAAGASSRRGEVTTARRLLEKAYDLAKEQKVWSRCVMTASLLADLAWEAGDNPTARQWFAAATEHIQESNDIDRAIQYRAVGIQLALDDGLFEKASNILAEAERSFPRIRHNRLAVDTLAYRVRIQLSAGRVPDTDTVDQLLKAHSAWRGHGLHDLAADTLLWSLQVAGRQADAATLRHEYLTQHRKDRFPIPVPMSRLR